jgi:hypothetical protein
LFLSGLIWRTFANMSHRMGMIWASRNRRPCCVIFCFRSSLSATDVFVTASYQALYTIFYCPPYTCSSFIAFLAISYQRSSSSSSISFWARRSHWVYLSGFQRRHELNALQPEVS